MFIPFVSCYMVEQMWHLSLCFVKSNWDIREHSSLCLMTAITAGWWQRLGPQVELTSANNIPRYHYGFWTKTHLMTTMATMANNIPRLTMAFEQRTHLMTTMESIKGKHQSLGDQSDHRTPFRPFPHLLVLKPAFQENSLMDLAAMSFMFCTCLIRYVWYIVFWKYIYVFSSHLWFRYRIPV